MKHRTFVLPERKKPMSLCYSLHFFPFSLCLFFVFFLFHPSFTFLLFSLSPSLPSSLFSSLLQKQDTDQNGTWRDEFWKGQGERRRGNESLESGTPSGPSMAGDLLDWFLCLVPYGRLATLSNPGLGMSSQVRVALQV